jgi:tetratricopeptide (TPR) repeat protein
VGLPFGTSRCTDPAQRAVLNRSSGDPTVTMQGTLRHLPAPEELRPNSEAEDVAPVYFVLHIPKTAGQTIQTHFAEHSASGVYSQPQRSLRPGSRMRANDFPGFGRARLISGHEISRSLEKLYPRREIRRIVLLRDPLQLQISLYNWRMMDHLAKGLGTYSFELHLRALPRNFIAHFLLSRWLEIPWLRLARMADSEKYEILNRTLANFWFVGAHSDCDRIIEAISSDLGVPPVAVARNTSADWQVHTGWRLVAAETLAPSIRDAIVAQSPLDQALWESWGAAGFEPARVRPAALAPGRDKAFVAREMVRPWFRFRCFIRRELVGRRPGAVLVNRANAARNAGEWARAARDYRRALRALPNAPAIWVQYGNALREAGHPAAAERAYREALKLGPGLADAHLQLGHALKLQGRIDEVGEAYQRAAMLDPTLDHVRSELSDLSCRVREVRQARGI